MFVEELKLADLQRLVIATNPTEVWSNMIDFGLVQDGEEMPDTDGIMKLLNDKTQSNTAQGTIMLSHVLDVPSDGSNMDADSDLEIIKSSVTSGDLVVLNVVRNNENDFRLKHKTEENIVSFFALLGIVCSVYLLFKIIKKLLK